MNKIDKLASEIIARNKLTLTEDDLKQDSDDDEAVDLETENIHLDKNTKNKVIRHIMPDTDKNKIWQNIISIMSLSPIDWLRSNGDQTQNHLLKQRFFEVNIDIRIYSLLENIENASFYADDYYVIWTEDSFNNTINYKKPINKYFDLIVKKNQFLLKPTLRFFDYIKNLDHDQYSSSSDKDSKLPRYKNIDHAEKVIKRKKFKPFLHSENREGQDDYDDPPC